MTQQLIWRDDYLIGVEKLDWEHQDLFERLNELHDVLSDSDDPAAIEACLGEIHAWRHLISRWKNNTYGPTNSPITTSTRRNTITSWKSRSSLH
ncbi:MAG: hypothetical protein CMM23_20810 [Rhodospirillaceae bacterium]|jgi:hypothetical protein|nr:hypothetical protein [Rhodospirillaceae bacterium]